MSSFLHDNLNQLSLDLGFNSWGTTALESPLSLEFYRQWLAQNYHGDMQYLERHLPQKENPKLLDPRLQSAFVFSHAYVPHPKPLPSSPLRTALYAQGEDYHFWLREKLERIATHLKQVFPDHAFLCSTDSGPILERDLAYRAGLGWVGKNTCLIDRQKGSLFLIGEILTSLPLQQKANQVADFCGTCTRCLDVCPTKALEKPRLLNAQKCISYLTIESRKTPAPEFREAIGDHFFGCDLCQTVCPWNQKVFGKQLDVQPLKALASEEKQLLLQELRQVLTLSGKQLQKKYLHSPLQRAGPLGLRRNAILVAANQGLKELAPEIFNWSHEERLKDLVTWALKKLGSQSRSV